MTYQIAAGHNNAAGLVDFDSLSTTVGGRTYRFYQPQAFGLTTPGVRRYRGSGISTISGSPTQIWNLSAGFFEHYDYLKATYCGTGATYSGLVTIRTQIYDHDTFANYNAVLELPFPTDPAFQLLLGGFQGFQIIMRAITAI